MTAAARKVNMSKNRVLAALTFAVFMLAAAHGALAQTAAPAPTPAPEPEIDDQNYSFRLALGNEPNMINLRFGESFPSSDEVLKDVSKWVVFDIDQGGIKKFQPDSVDVSRRGGSVTLHMGAGFNADGHSFDTSLHKVVVQFMHGNLPSATLGRPKRKNEGKTFVAAKGKDAADIYFSGEAATAREAKPQYSIEAKGGYLFNLRGTRTRSDGRRVLIDLGSIGVKGTFNSGAASSIDPDSITVGGTYRKLFVVGTAAGFRLNSDFLGFEFDKDNKTRNLVSEANLDYVFPALVIGTNKVASFDVLAGAEGGHNYKNELAPDGIGNFYRWKFGANAYFTVFKPFKQLARITYNTEYKLRLPRSAEIFYQTIDGEEQKSLTKRPRHYIATDLDFMFTDAVGIALKHRYGSLPPAFKLVDNKVSVGLVVQFQQVNK